MTKCSNQPNVVWIRFRAAVPGLVEERDRSGRARAQGGRLRTPRTIAGQRANHLEQAAAVGGQARPDQGGDVVMQGVDLRVGVRPWIRERGRIKRAEMRQ